MQKRLVWDLPVRLGHWLMVSGFTLAWLTGDWVFAVVMWTTFRFFGFALDFQQSVWFV